MRLPDCNLKKNIESDGNTNMEKREKKGSQRAFKAKLKCGCFFISSNKKKLYKYPHFFVKNCIIDFSFLLLLISSLSLKIHKPSTCSQPSTALLLVNYADNGYLPIR
jgi:hypothetical protein